MSDLGFCACARFPRVVHTVDASFVCGCTHTGVGELTVLLPWWRPHLEAPG